MRILFTGATSFTGMWFARQLAQDGHYVFAAIRGSQDDYRELRAERLMQLTGCELAWNAGFGSPRFLDLAGRPFDVLCHHASEVKDYKSPDFDVARAVASNTHCLPAVLERLRDKGCNRILLTGSVFEDNEGKGSAPMRAFSPYGFSKTLTAELFQKHAEQQGFALGKFVIPNPFGPYEEPRFTEYLMRCWKNGSVAKINTPLYVRDNVPVSLLAMAYGRFTTTLPKSGFVRFNPSYYVESQRAFAERFAREIGQRLRLKVPLEIADQTSFSEPEIRINTDVLRDQDYGWSELGFWRDTAHYYAQRLDIPVI